MEELLIEWGFPDLVDVFKGASIIYYNILWWYFTMTLLMGHPNYYSYLKSI